MVEKKTQRKPRKKVIKHKQKQHQKQNIHIHIDNSKKTVQRTTSNKPQQLTKQTPQIITRNYPVYMENYKPPQLSASVSTPIKEEKKEETPTFNISDPYPIYMNPLRQKDDTLASSIETEESEEEEKENDNNNYDDDVDDTDPEIQRNFPTAFQIEHMSDLHMINPFTGRYILKNTRNKRREAMIRWNRKHGFFNKNYYSPHYNPDYDIIDTPNKKLDNIYI
jgi:hypothetical protein